MRTGITTVALVAGLGAAASPASAYTALYAFGDSLSDVGNVYASTPLVKGGPFPIPAYSGAGFTGRFTNGSNWLDDLSAKLGLPGPTPSLKRGNDFAVGGAETGATNVHPETPLVDLDQQVQAFKLVNPSPTADALYTLDIGGNDIRDALGAYASDSASLQTFVQQAVGNTVNAIDDLFANGARDLLYFEVPDLSLVPAFQKYGSLAGQIAQEFNQAVLAGVAPLKAEGLTVFDVPVFADLDAIVANPGQFGFTNASSPCFSGDYQTAGSVCSNPDQTLFWDTIHPTTAAHAVVADVAFDTLRGSSPGGPKSPGAPAAPEPSTWALMLAGLAGLGVARYRRARRRAAAV